MHIHQTRHGCESIHSSGFQTARQWGETLWRSRRVSYLYEADQILLPRIKAHLVRILTLAIENQYLYICAVFML